MATVSFSLISGTAPSAVCWLRISATSYPDTNSTPATGAASAPWVPDTPPTINWKGCKETWHPDAYIGLVPTLSSVSSLWKCATEFELLYIHMMKDTKIISYCKIHSNYDIPLQYLGWQDLDSVGCPWHGLPPYIGSGLEHFRTRVSAPFPHVTLQVPHAPHELQSPFTVDKLNILKEFISAKITELNKTYRESLLRETDQGSE